MSREQTNSGQAVRLPPKKRSWSFQSQAFRGVLYQVIAVGVIALAAWFLIGNTLENMRVRGIKSGFDFLTQPAGFDIGESVIAYDSNNPYWKAFLVGVVNTLKVAIIGCILTTILGTLLGVGRFSKNGLVRGACMTYVELFRNVPVLIQLLMWYLLFAELLPEAAEAWRVGNVYLSKGGLTYPALKWVSGHWWMLWGGMAGLLAAWFYRRWAKAQFELTGRQRSMLLWPVLMLVLGVLLGWFVGGASAQFDIPKKGEFIIEGGSSVTPEFMAVLFGLTTYTAAFVAEVVRAGIASVPRGQSEAAQAIGLSRGQEMQQVLLPQALRVIIPPMTNQYLNLTKNSSLAVAIGYPDVVSIANTALNQTGRAVECIAIVMLVYLTTSLTTSLLMNWYNKRAAIQER
jgi:general L-amino acid transport system permease protein